ncbi:MAG: hypothetical protein M3464_03220 [Chloroflexota bacterium]|nr:hypothetical protein [Chloroflexota bacterium]
MFITADVLEQGHPEFVEMLLGNHETHLDMDPTYTEEDLARDLVPTLPIAWKTDP